METEKIKYPIQAYRMIFTCMRETFGEAWYASVRKQQWNIWQRQIKEQLFDNDIIAPEAIAVIPGIDKRQWPAGTGFFSRVRDMVLLTRRNKPKPIEIHKGPVKLGSLFDKHSYPQMPS